MSEFWLDQGGESDFGTVGMLVGEAVAELHATMDWIRTEKPFLAIHDTAPIKYAGENGVLVWDFGIWNELTFVDNETRRKQSLFTSFSDAKTKEKFDELVSKYGI